MTARIIIDPITRIEGHLRIEVELQDGKVANAWSSATLFRGLETLLKGRDPRDAWLITQRVCGVCTYVHGLASVRCVEHGAKLRIPANARLIRSLLLGAQFLHDHLVHFYVLHAPDWVDMASALTADPEETAKLAAQLSPAGRSGVSDFRGAQDRLKTLVGDGQRGILASGLFGSPAYKLPPDLNLLLAAHYFELLRQQVRTARMMAIFGAKNPHLQSLIVGGVTCALDLEADRIAEFRSLWQETMDFVNDYYLPDVKLLVGHYRDWSAIGGTENHLSYGEFPQGGEEPESHFLPGGVIIDGALSSVEPVGIDSIEEHVKRSWYEGEKSLPPASGETKPRYDGLDVEKRYSWLKAPRYNGEPMEVGPLSRMLVAYARGQEAARKAVDGLLAETGLTQKALLSTLGRTIARALETRLIGEAMGGWIDELVDNLKQGDRALATSYELPSSAGGVGLDEVPRGALGHWIEIKEGKIENYQMVVPSTWNLGPRCEAGKLGPLERALIGTPVADAERPVEVLRTVHSFDPCMACGVHVIEPQAMKIRRFRVA